MTLGSGRRKGTREGVPGGARCQRPNSQSHSRSRSRRHGDRGHGLRSGVAHSSPTDTGRQHSERSSARHDEVGSHPDEEPEKERSKQPHANVGHDQSGRTRGQPSAASTRQNTTATENLAAMRLQWLWDESRAKLERLYFSDGSLLSSTEDQADFEAFFERYLAFLRKQSPDFGLPADFGRLDATSSAETHETQQADLQQVRSASSAAQRAAASLPRMQDRRFRSNFALSSSASKMELGASSTRSTGAAGDRLGIALFEGVLQHYEDFRQKQALGKLKKLQSVVRGLPVASKRDEIVRAVDEHPVVLIAGDTGCGKSTQVPQYLFSAESHRRIVVTQPRRLAAVSLARRVAHERLQRPGTSVIAHQIRFESTRSRQTRILFMTEGILLRLLESDPELSDFEVLVVDEVHERHLSVDLLLGLLREVSKRRPSLRLVLMSATLQKELFVDFFNLPKEAVVEVPGRMYPVDVEHIALPDEPQTIRQDIVKAAKRRQAFDTEPYVRLLRRIETSTSADERGDVLIFVSGAHEIEALVGAISEFASRSKRWIALPLHSQLPMEQQDKVFDIAPAGVRKAIVSTNIAETSVTIDGVRFVIDSGKMKGLDVDSASSVRHLAEKWLSQASAEQRKGRAGRTGPGHCFRFYSKRLFDLLEPFTTPEVHKAQLETPLLQILALGFELHRFRFPEAPRAESVAAALQRLLLMRALVSVDLPPDDPDDSREVLDVDDDEGGTFIATSSDGTLPAGGWASGFAREAGDSLLRGLGLTEPLRGKRPHHQLALTPMGRVLSRLPVDVGVGKMLILALVFQVQSHAVVLAGASGLHSPRMQKHGERNSGHWSFDHRHGDAFTTLRVYQAWLAQRSRNSGGSDSQSRRWTREQGIDERTLFELNKLNAQLHDLLRDGVGPASGAVEGNGRRLGSRLRRDKMRSLEEATTGKKKEDGGLDPEDRRALEEELEELRQREAVRQRRLLSLQDGEGALIEDERGLGYSADARLLGDSDGEDAANASGGEGNPNRELNRRKRGGKGKKGKGKGKGRDGGKVRLPQNDGLAERMRKRNLEFELRYGAHGHTARAMEKLSERQEELLRVVVSCGMYPNLALPHEKNKERAASDCVFHTRQVPFVNLHPSSSMFAEAATALSPWEGFAFGSILQTHLPFLLHVTRCPVLPVVLLGAAVVDTSPDCRMLIADEWLQLTFEDAEDCLDALEQAYLLRISIQRSLDDQVAQLFEADCEDDVEGEFAEATLPKPPPSAPLRLRQLARRSPKRCRGADLEARMLSFWHWKVAFKWQTLMPNEYAAYKKAGEGQRSDAGLAGAKADSSVVIKCWLRYGTVSEVGLDLASSLMSDHLAVAWKCPRCRHTFRFTRGDIAKHQSECIGDRELATGGPSSSRAPLGSTVVAAGEASSASNDKVWTCEACGATLPKDARTEIFRHQRSHGV